MPHPPSPLSKVKICGITRLHDARFAAAAGADFLGFIQHAPSPRYVAPDVAREIVDWIAGPTPVGVFVDASADEVNATCARAGFRMAQLHGSEAPATVAAVDVPVIKAIRVAHDASAEQVRALAAPYLGVADFLLLDTFHTSLFGGTGESFNWRVARDLAAETDLFLAGGLTAGNVAHAIATMRPFAVDVSSSVESAPGEKDLDKLAAFLDAVASARGEERAGRGDS